MLFFIGVFVGIFSCMVFQVIADRTCKDAAAECAFDCDDCTCHCLGYYCHCARKNAEDAEIEELS